MANPGPHGQDLLIPGLGVGPHIHQDKGARKVLGLKFPISYLWCLSLIELIVKGLSKHLESSVWLDITVSVILGKLEQRGIEKS